MQMKAFLVKNSADHSEITVVKVSGDRERLVFSKYMHHFCSLWQKYLADGSPFAPVFRRQLLHTHRLENPPSSMWIPEVLKGGPSPLIRTDDDRWNKRITW